MPPWVSDSMQALPIRRRRLHNQALVAYLWLLGRAASQRATPSRASFLVEARVVLAPKPSMMRRLRFCPTCEIRIRPCWRLRDKLLAQEAQLAVEVLVQQGRVAKRVELFQRRSLFLCTCRLHCLDNRPPSPTQKGGGAVLFLQLRLPLAQAQPRLRCWNSLFPALPLLRHHP